MEDGEETFEGEVLDNTFNLGLSMGYNTVVNDYGERNKSFSLMFGTYF